MGAEGGGGGTRKKLLRLVVGCPNYHSLINSTTLTSVRDTKWRCVYKTQQQIQVNFAYVKIGGYVSDNVSGGTTNQRKTAWVQNFLRVKVEGTE